MVGVVEDGLPVCASEMQKLVGVVGGTRCHGENFTGVRVHGNDGADLAFERLFRSHLNVEVDGELDVRTGSGELLTEHTNLFAMGVDDDVSRSIGAAENGVIGFFDS